MDIQEATTTAKAKAIRTILMNERRGRSNESGNAQQESQENSQSTEWKRREKHSTAPTREREQQERWSYETTHAFGKEAIWSRRETFPFQEGVVRLSAQLKGLESADPATLPRSRSTSTSRVRRAPVSRMEHLSAFVAAESRGVGGKVTSASPRERRKFRPSQS